MQKNAEKTETTFKTVAETTRNSAIKHITPNNNKK